MAQTYNSPIYQNLTVRGTITGDVSSSTVTATGSNTPRTPAEIAADVFNVKSYGAACDGSTIDTTAFQLAATAIQNSTFGGVIYVPSGDCVIGAQITASIGANQRFDLRSDGQHAARLHWTNAASAGFAITLNPVTNATWISNGPSVSVENITGVTDWSTTTSQTLIAIVATAGSNPPYQRPSIPAVTVSNLNSISKTNSGGFAGLLSLTNIATVKLENMSFWASAGDTAANAVALISTGGVYTGIRINGLRQQNGGTALTVTDNFQGIYVTDMQTVGTQHSISWTNPGGYAGAGSLIVDHSQLNSLVSEIDTNAVSQVQVNNSYLLGNAAGWHGMEMTGGIQMAVSGNLFTQTASSDSTSSGTIVNNVTGGAIGSNTFVGLPGNSSGGAPVLLEGTTNGVVVAGNHSASALVTFDATTGKNNQSFANSFGNTQQPAGTLGGNMVAVFGDSTGTNANNVNSSASNDVVVGAAHNINSGCSASSISGFDNTCSAQDVLISGVTNSVTAADSTVLGQRGAVPFIGCVSQANGTQQVGGTQQLLCTWQLHTTSTAPVRATSDGTNNYAGYNVWALSGFGPSNTTANMEISIAMADTTTPANSGTWTLPIGQLAYQQSGGTTTWSAGTPVALGTAFGVSIAADGTSTGLNMTITPGSNDALTFTISFRVTIVRGY